MSGEIPQPPQFLVEAASNSRIPPYNFTAEQLDQLVEWTNTSLQAGVLNTPSEEHKEPLAPPPAE